MIPPPAASRLLFLSVLLAAALAITAISLLHAPTATPAPHLPTQPPPARAEIEAACRLHLTEAEQKLTNAITARVAEFSRFIESRKQGARPFSLKVVSLYGKWRAVKSYLPLADDNGHSAYVMEQFGQHVFTSAELSSAFELTIAGALKDMESIENELAVALRQEITGSFPAPAETAQVTDEYRALVERLMAASQWDTAKTVGSLAVSEVAAVVTSQVLVRLGVSAGILATGAANSWWSFGAAFLIGILVDAIWEWVDDPAGDIERELELSLEQLSVQGSAALHVELMRLAAARRAAWSQTLARIIP